jgi:predicted nucleic acid-binding protein
MIEFHALATRPAEANGLGMTSAEARAQAQIIESVFPLLSDVASIYPHWCALIDAYGIIGRQVFDARLVAVMLAHGISHLLTLNPAHFRRYKGISVVEPDQLIMAA